MRTRRGTRDSTKRRPHHPAGSGSLPRGNKTPSTWAINRGCHGYRSRTITELTASVHDRARGYFREGVACSSGARIARLKLRKRRGRGVDT